MRQRDLKTLKALVEVRKVQQQGAEMAVARADSALNALQADRAQTVSQLGDLQGGWSQSIGGPVIGLSVAGAWSTRILDGEASLRGLSADILNAEQVRAERAAAWRMASARGDPPEGLGDPGRRKGPPARRKTKPGQKADRSALKGGRP